MKINKPAFDASGTDDDFNEKIRVHNNQFISFGNNIAVSIKGDIRNGITGMNHNNLYTNGGLFYPLMVD